MRSIVILGLSAIALQAAQFCPVPTATTWCELRGAQVGTTIANASITMGTGQLTDIFGQIGDGTGGADMYAIYISNPAAFSATSVGYTGRSGTATADTNPALFLFDPSGNGLEGNDDQSVSSTQAFLNSTNVSTAGFYYLLVVPSGNLPEYKKSGNMLPVFTTLTAGQISGPVTGAKSFSNYSKNGCGAGCAGGYDIQLQGAQFANLPEPGTLGLIGAGLLALGVLRFRRRR